MQRSLEGVSATGFGFVVTLAAFAALVDACGAAADSTSRPSSELDLVDAPPPHDVGCTLVQTRVEDGGCRIDWSCTDGGLHTYACEPDDGGDRCVCLRGSTPAESRLVADAACVATAVATTCGWAVAP